MMHLVEGGYGNADDGSLYLNQQVLKWDDRRKESEPWVS